MGAGCTKGNQDGIANTDTRPSQSPKEKSVKILSEIRNDAKNNSILAKYLRTDGCDIEELASRKTKFGAGIVDLIPTGHKIPSSKVGIYATDEDSYQVFHDLFTFTCIELYGIGQNSSGEQTNDEGIDRKFDAVVSVRVRSARNFSGFAFPSFITQADRIVLKYKIVAALKANIADGEYYALKYLSKKKRQEWIDAHYLYHESDNFLKIGGFYRDWPSGRGIFMSEDRTNIIWVNEEDHVRVIALQEGNDFKAVFDKSFGLLDKLEKSLKCAKHKDFGGLTSCPTNLGTGMRASVHVRLPNIIKAKGSKGLKEMCKEMSLDLRGTRGENTGLEGDTFDVSNKKRFGLQPLTAFKQVVDGVAKLLDIDSNILG